MNRLKLWLYVVLLLGAGAGNLYFLSGWLTARSVAHIDRELRSSAAVADARVRWLGVSATSLADAAARSPSVVAALADPAANPLAPAEDAVAAAAEALKSDAATGGLVAVAGPQGLSARVGGASGKAVEVPGTLVADAQAGRRSQAWVRIDGSLWLVAAVPAGRGGAVALGVPLDAAQVQALRAVTGVDYTAFVDGKASATTLPSDEAAAVSSAQTATGRRPVDVGRLGAVKTTLGWAPAMRILFANPPAARALAVPIEGAGAAALVMSHATEPFFEGLATYQVIALVAMALFLLAGILLGLFMSEESRAVLPRELVSAADRMSRGDFSARAPTLSGSAGKIAAGLNRAAEAAQHGGRASPVATHAEAHGEPSLAGAAPGASTEAHAEPAFASGPAAAVGASGIADASGAAAVGPESEPPPPSRLESSPEPAEGEPASTESSTGDRESTAAREPSAETADWQPEPEALFAAAEPTPEPAASGEAEPVARASAKAGRDAWGEPDESAEPAVTQPLFASRDASASTPEALATAAALPGTADAAVAAPPFARDDDESHWRSVFDDFVRLRGVTGEPREIPYDQFRARLERNRAQLKDKHGARTVRFQPYVKEGKVALRATPVR